MEQLALALQAIKSRMGAGGGVQPDMSGAPAGYPGHALAYGQPTTGGMTGTMPLEDLFLPPREAQQTDMDAGSKLIQKSHDDMVKQAQKLREKADQAALDHKTSAESLMNLHYPELVKAKKLTDSQKYIPAVIAALANLSPEVRRTNAANSALNNLYGTWQGQNERDANDKNKSLDAAFRDQYNRASLGLKETGDRADRLSQDATNFESRLGASENALIGHQITADTRRAVADIYTKSRERIASMKDPSHADVQSEMYRANAKSIAAGGPALYTEQDIAQVPYADQFKKLAEADLAKERGQTEEVKQTVLLPAQAEKALSQSGLAKAHTDEIREKTKWIPKEKQALIAVQYARVYKLRQAPAAKLGPGEKDPTVAQRRTALTGLVKSLEGSLKEAPINLLGEGMPDPRAEIQQQVHELQDELMQLDRSVLGKDPAPK